MALRAWLENRRRTLVLGEVKHPRHQWHMEGEDDTNERIAAFNSYCRIASWDKPWQISRAMEVATPSSSKMLRGLLHHLHRRLVSGNIFVLRVAGYQHCCRIGPLGGGGSDFSWLHSRRAAGHKGHHH